MKAIDESLRFDNRRAKAMSLAHALMGELDDILPREVKGRVADRILEVMYNNGLAWTTDEERLAFGLDPRDDMGWTSSERVKLEQMRHEAMYRISQTMIIKPSVDT